MMRAARACLSVPRKRSLRKPSGSHTPLSSRERAIEAVLGGLGESAAQIEHWGREYWHPIDVHRDVDEAVARGGAVRSPRSVCLLFLEVTTQAKPIAHELQPLHIRVPQPYTTLAHAHASSQRCRRHTTPS